MFRIFKKRRKFNRISAHHLVKYKRIEDDSQPMLSFARNLSAGGVLLYASEPGVIGDRLQVTINFPGAEKPIVAEGKVLRSKQLKKIGGYEIGVEFINIDEKEFELMKNKIDADMAHVKGGKKNK
jgi:c-di-GMP-binding flagellar brake protein YcgR